MKRHTFRWRSMVGFFRAGHPADAPQLGHLVSLAMCPAAAGAVRPSASSGFVSDRRACRSPTKQRRCTCEVVVRHDGRKRI